MTTKLGNIVNAVSALKKLAQQDLPLKVSYNIYKLVNVFNEHLSYFDDNREKIAQLADNQDRELEELLDTDIEIKEFQKVKVSLDTNVKLSAMDLMMLDDYVEFYEEIKDE